MVLSKSSPNIHGSAFFVWIVHQQREKVHISNFQIIMHIWDQKLLGYCSGVCEAPQAYTCSQIVDIFLWLTAYTCSAANHAALKEEVAGKAFFVNITRIHLMGFRPISCSSGCCKPMLPPWNTLERKIKCWSQRRLQVNSWWLCCNRSKMSRILALMILS